MEIILKQDVDKLGYENDLVDVKPGYARNFLIPQGFAIAATGSAKKVREETLKQRSFREEKIKGDAQDMAKKLEKVTLKIGAKVGEKGKIFGSINNIQVAEALKKEGFDVDKKNVKLKGDVIKEVGTYEAEVNLHRDISATVKFEVAED